MHNRTKLFTLILGMLAMCFPHTAGAYDLRAYFPLDSGRFWNFTGAPDGSSSTWAVNGALTLKNVGRVMILAMDNGRFLCLRDDWEGTHIYAEYGPDGYRIPEQPLLFLPSDLKLDVPTEQSVTLKVFSDPEGNINFKETGKSNQTIKFMHKNVEDVTVGGHEFKNCVVIEKVTTEKDSTTSETLYLAPGVGPIKRVLAKGKEKTTYVINSCVGGGIIKAENFSIKDLQPFKPGFTWTYKDQKGLVWNTVTKDKEPVEKVASLPFAEDTGDIYYYVLDDRGLIMTQKFWSLVGGCTDFHPPDSPLQVFPATLSLGAYYSSVSNARVHTWPSMTLMEEFYPEMHCSSIVVAKEDVTVLAGKYRGCVKVCQVTVSRNFNMNNEQIQIGYLWLAKDTGVVKKQLLEMTNYFNPLRINRISSVKFWDLMKIDKKGR